jgi:predicted GIY-YIG superfamily endonuclease
MDQAYSVYVIENPIGRRYIGLSEDVAVRLEQHNAGVSKWTAKHGPWSLVWTSSAMPLGEARKLENQLKRAKGGNGFFANTGLERSPGL